MLNFIKDYWTVLMFLIGISGTLLTFIYYCIIKGEISFLVEKIENDNVDI